MGQYFANIRPRAFLWIGLFGLGVLMNGDGAKNRTPFPNREEGLEHTLRYLIQLRSLCATPTRAPANAGKPLLF